MPEDETEPPGGACLEFEAVSGLLEELRRLRRQRIPVVAAGACMAFAGLTGAFSICLTVGEVAWPWLVTMGGIAAVLTFFAINRRSAMRRADIMRRLVRHRDIRIVPELLESLDDMKYTQLQFRIRQALVELLPRLDEPDAWLFDGGAVRAAVRFRLASVDYSLVCALLDALGRVGAIWALRDVEWLARRSGESETITRVRETAARCAKRLRTLAEQARSPGRLLRPAEHVDNEELLRPATTSNDEAAKRLLRPDARDESRPD